jgi:hypothetical protein
VKRTLVERVAKEVDDFMFCWPSKCPPGVVKSEAKHIIAMMRRHDARKTGKR